MQLEQLANSSLSAGNSITDQEFIQFQRFIYERAGISISDEKKSLVISRLAKRIRHYNLPDYSSYLRLLENPKFENEKQVVVDLLTTNETYFFREPKHFDFLRDRVLPELKSHVKVRLWCGASSSGEEPYSLGMVLNESLGSQRWEMLASDISTRMLQKARQAMYPMSVITKIPKQYIHKYCLRGVREQTGRVLMDEVLRKNIEFKIINLVKNIPDLGEFDIIFLRNVMIYFNMETKQKTLHNLIQHLKPGGYLFVSHSESLHNVTKKLKLVMPSIYRKEKK